MLRVQAQNQLPNSHPPPTLTLILTLTLTLTLALIDKFEEEQRIRKTEERKRAAEASIRDITHETDPFALVLL